MSALRRLAAAVLLSAAAVAAPAFAQAPAPAASNPADLQPGDRVVGDPRAPVTILEYASFTCPHCAVFHSEIAPKLKAGVVAQGKAKLVFRDFPLDPDALKASVLVRCAPLEKQPAFIDVLFQQQKQWSNAADIPAALTKLGLLGGLSKERIEQCFNDKSLEDATLAQRVDGARAFSINSTPTIVVNGRKVDNYGAETIEKMVNAAGN